MLRQIASCADASCSFLSSQGWQVDAAVDALECLAKLRRSVPDLLILDLELPWGGGDGVLGLLREQPQLQPNRVVLTSAVASAHVLDKLASFHQQPPFVQALTKPFPLSALLDDRASMRRMCQSNSPTTADAVPFSLSMTSLRFGMFCKHICNARASMCGPQPAARKLLIIAAITAMRSRSFSSTSGCPASMVRKLSTAFEQLDVDIPVCFMTGSPGDYEPGDLLRQGARHLFGKPLLLDEIVRVVRDLANEPVGQLQEN